MLFEFGFDIITNCRIKIILVDLDPRKHFYFDIRQSEYPKQSTLEKVYFNLKNESEQTFPIEALSTPFICLPVKNQLINFAKTRFDYLRGLQLADSGSTDEIDLLIGSDFCWSVVYKKNKNWQKQRTCGDLIWLGFKRTGN